MKTSFRPPLTSPRVRSLLAAGACAGVLIFILGLLVADGSVGARAAMMVLGIGFLVGPALIARTERLTIHDDGSIELTRMGQTRLADAGRVRGLVLRPLLMGRLALFVDLDGAPVLDLSWTAFDDNQLKRAARALGVEVTRDRTGGPATAN